MLEHIGAAIKGLRFVKAARWRRPSESKDRENCVLMDFEVDVPPDAMKFLGMTLAILQRLDRRVEADHPVFRYMADRQRGGRDTELTLSLSIRRRDAAP